MAVINGSTGNDNLPDTAGDDTIFADDGNDTITVTTGRDSVDGWNGEDTLIIRWGNATQRTDVDGSFGQAYVDTGGGNFTASLRRVGYTRIEHFDVQTGSGDDRLEGIANSWDKLDGGAGDDIWKDFFGGLLTGMSVDMAAVSSGGGQSYADGTVVRNLEIADLDLTQGDDTFRDHGNFNDTIFGDDGNDDLGTSNGRDSFDGWNGDDTLTIDWSNASMRADVDGSFGQAYVDTAGGGSYSTSDRRVGFTRFEHLDVRTGAGDDRLEGIANSWDKLNGRGGDDIWQDSFSALATGMSVDMEMVSTSGGQTYADGTEVRNLEIASLGLTQGHDTFRDHGAYNDTVFGDDGNDDLGTSGGRDSFDGWTGTDTLTIDWRTASQNADVDGSFGQAYVDTSGGGSYSTSDRRVGFTRFEHLDVRTGAGDDRLEGIANQWDKLDGGAGDDIWQDVFASLLTGLSIDMALVSTSGGQTYADGTEVRNLEIASLGLTQGHDTFRDHGAYNDTVFGDDGNDDLGTSGGRDSFDGWTGDDTLTIDWSDATMRADVDGSFGQAYVDTGGGGNYSSSDRRVGFTRFEHLDVRTGSGDDRLEGIANQWDKLDGGAGDDIWQDSFSALAAGMFIRMSKVSKAAGKAFADGTVARNLEIADLDLTRGHDTFRDHGAYDDTVFGGAGNDDLGTTDGRDSFDGWTGTDTLTIDWRTASQNADVDGSFGQAYVDTGGGNFTASLRRVSFTRFEQMNVKTGSGNDRLEGAEGNDTLRAGGGKDTLTGGSGNDTLLGGGGKDVLDGQTGDDKVNGGNGNDTLGGGAGNDTVQGGSGNDLLRGDAGNDQLVGGGGQDTVDYSGSSAGVSVNLATGTGSGGDAAGDAISGVEHIIGSGHGDNLTGNGKANTLSGGAGDDSLNALGGDDMLVGGGGADTLNGGKGRDTLIGGSGADLLSGKGGNDTASYASSGSGVNVSLASGTGSGGDAAGDTLQGIENLTGSGNRDTLVGDGGGNILAGGGARDVLRGNAGADTLIGGNGNDLLNGGKGRDQLEGGNGNDRLTGGAGLADRFVYAGTANEGSDTITDFKDGKDIIEIGGAVTFADLTIVNAGGGNARVSWNGTEVLVENTLASQLTIADFDFV